MTLTITQDAALQIRRAAEGEDGQATLRLAARRIEDGSLDYGLGFDRPRPGDLEMPLEGITVVVAPASRELLEQTILDYVEIAPGDFRFVFAPANGSGEGQS